MLWGIITVCDLHACLIFDIISLYVSRLCFYKTHKRCTHEDIKVLFYNKHSCYQTTPSSCRYNSTHIIISLLSYTDATVWFLPSFEDRLSPNPGDAGSRIFLFFHVVLPLSSSPCYGDSTVRYRKLIGELACCAAFGNHPRGRRVRACIHDLGGEGGGQREGSICCGWARGTAASGGPGREPIREWPWHPFVRAACGYEWKHENNGRADREQWIENYI